MLMMPRQPPNSHPATAWWHKRTFGRGAPRSAIETSLAEHAALLRATEAVIGLAPAARLCRLVAAHRELSPHTPLINAQLVVCLADGSTGDLGGAILRARS